jgi:uncharacterized membrane protein
MKQDEDKITARNNKGPIFITRGDGLGWTLNFDRPAGYVVLAILLAIFVIGVLLGTGFVKLFSR